jgi:hypothetical protein
MRGYYRAAAAFHMVEITLLLMKESRHKQTDNADGHHKQQPPPNGRTGQSLPRPFLFSSTACF